MRYILVLLVLIFPAVGLSQVPDGFSANYRNLTALRLNPLGLVNASAVNLQHPLYKSDDPLYQTNYAALTVQPLLSPAYVRMGIGAELQPLSILRVSVLYEKMYFFGNFDFLQSFPNASGDWSDSGLEASTEEAYSTGGAQLTLGTLVQIKVGDIAARTSFKLMNFSMDVNEGDTTWYDPMLDALVSADGWGVTNDLDVVYLTKTGWVLGVRDTITTMWLDDEDDPNPISHRIGPLISYQVHSDPGKRVDSVSAFFVMNWYLSHRYRTGEDVGQSIPYVAAGLTVTGQLF
ncbi:hypothetical protein FRD01_20985 [Microvenator marinus]|uniref:Uncharacterized protein n=1 Tax=Microvenator marinus TaxID=2600177 RepID=A0A5B8XWY4_9DELT|nr:hypothetical protein [Microvenator marinus]QED29667.1 hypothetical protein FRD01_20985 [Microvenator marinus]